MKKLIAKDLMTATPLTVLEDVKVRDAIDKINGIKAGSVLVVNGQGILVGIFTERDVLLYCNEEGFLDSPISKYMTQNLVCVPPDEKIKTLHEKFKSVRFRHLPVVEAGKPVGMISMRDLFKHWSEILAYQKEKLSKKYDRAMSVVVHDLRSPIYAVRSINELLLNNETTLTEYISNEFPNLIETSCVAMAQLIDDLLDLSSVKEGIIELEKEESDVVDLLEGVVKSFGPNASAKNINVRIHKSVENYELPLDKRRMVQVFQNLISNTIKYSSPGASVDIKVESSDKGAFLSFIDYGQGIKPTELPKVFDELCKISSKPTANEASTGLGLSITRKLVEAHGGNISVSSEPNVETCFRIYLPKGSTYVETSAA